MEERALGRMLWLGRAVVAFEVVSGFALGGHRLR
jgi:hypothetical protein